jgi:hypothetical protein
MKKAATGSFTKHSGTSSADQLAAIARLRAEAATTRRECAEIRIFYSRLLENAAKSKVGVDSADARSVVWRMFRAYVNLGGHWTDDSMIYALGKLKHAYLSEEVIVGWVYVPNQEKPLTVHLQIKGQIVASRLADIPRELHGPGKIMQCGYEFRRFYNGTPGGLRLADVKVLVDIDETQEEIAPYPGARILLATEDAVAEEKVATEWKEKAATEPKDAVDRRKAKKLSRKKPSGR